LAIQQHQQPPYQHRLWRPAVAAAAAAVACRVCRRCWWRWHCGLRHTPPGNHGRSWVATRVGKEPSLLEFGSVRVLPNIRVHSVRVLSSYGKMKVRLWFGSLCRVFGSVWFYAGSYPHLPSLHFYSLRRICSVSQKIQPRFSDIFSQTVWDFSPNFTCLLIFLSTLD